MVLTTRSKSARAAGDTCGCAGAVGFAVPRAGAAAAGRGAGATDGAAAGGAVLVAPPAAGAPAGAAAGAGASRVIGFAGCITGRLGPELQAPSTASASQASADAARVSAPGVRSLEAGNRILYQLRLAVARGLELRERLKAPAHPLVVHTVLGARGIQLVRLDRLLFERKHLLLEQ